MATPKQSGEALGKTPSLSQLLDDGQPPLINKAMMDAGSSVLEDFRVPWDPHLLTALYRAMWWHREEDEV